MAEAVVADVAKELIDIIEKLTDQNDSHLMREVDKELLILADKLKSIKTLLDNADDEILYRLQLASYAMESALNDWILKQNKVFPFIPSSCLCFGKVSVHRDITKKIIYLKDQILFLKDRLIKDVSYATRTELFPREQSTFLIDSAKVLGRDRDVDILVNKLMADRGSQHESSIPVLSIVGMGGLGKTTLAQIIYNHRQVEKFYDLRIWICVMHTFNLATIAKEILKSIGVKSPQNTDNLDVLLARVREYILGKRFLLVLDGIWTEDRSKWEPLEKIFRCGALGSKILVTTRSLMVVHMMGSKDDDIYRLGLLTDEDCWLILSLMAYFERKGLGFQEIGRRVARRCNGLPLAAKTLGSLMFFKNSWKEWSDVLTNSVWKLEEEELGILPILRLQYNKLSPTLRQCFSYCVIFPKDTRIDAQRLIENWMALGYLGSDIRIMELKGRKCVDELAMRYLFHDFEIGGLNEKIRRFKMHDLVHEFAQYIRSDRVEGARMNTTTCQACDPSLVSKANEFCSLFWDEEEYPPSFCDCLTCLRVLSMNGHGFRSIPQGMENLIQLRWLDLSGNIISQENLQTIFQLYYLQTLRLSDCNIEEIAMEIENLIHLRHLDLSFNESLKELPQGICGLHELRILVISYCKSLSRIPEGLAELTSLYRLSEFRGGSGCSKFRILNNLDRLSEDLRLIIRLGDGDLKEIVKDVREARLWNKMHIRKFSILFEDEIVETEECDGVRMDVADALEPHPNLQRFCIRGYKGSELPLSRIVSPFNELRSILLGECTRLSSLPPLGILQHLEEIEIMGLEGLKFVGREFLGIEGGNTDIQSSIDNLIAFPELKKLTFKGCPKWKVWEDITAEEEQHFTIMPRLTHLTIEDCPALKKLPRSLLRKAWPLERLEVAGSEELQQDIDDFPALLKLPYRDLIKLTHGFIDKDYSTSRQPLKEKLKITHSKEEQQHCRDIDMC